MEIWQLNTFKVVAQTLNFTTASKKLGLTQSAVSQQIKSLEEELEVKLFDRNRRQVTITSQGNRVLDYATKILDQIALMRREIVDNKENLQGVLRVVAVTRSLNSPFSQIKLDFQKLYPEVNLCFEAVLKSENIFESIRQGTADLGFIVTREPTEDFLQIPYGKFEMCLVVGKNHRLANRNEVLLEELADDEWILFEEKSWLRKIIDEIFALRQFAPAKIFESNDGNVIGSLIKDGAGVGFLPGWGIADILDEGKLIHLRLKDIKCQKPLSIVIEPHNRSKLLSVFVNYLLDKKVRGIEFEQQSQPPIA